uniref:Uncharacterized protein n=1 Tax=Parascaris univalens TaxID=6257 RepID=A0A915C0B7_PARUN
MKRIQDGSSTMTDYPAERPQADAMNAQMDDKSSSAHTLRFIMFGCLRQARVGYTSAWREDEMKTFLEEDLANLTVLGGGPEQDFLNPT